MAIPAVGSAAVELDEADAAFDHAAREQTAHAKLGGGLVVQAVELARGGGFIGDVDDFRGAGLHAEGEFVSRDAGGEFGVHFGGGVALAIEFADQIEGSALLRITDAVWGGEVEDRGTAAAEDGSLIGGGEEAVAPGGGAAFDPALR